eukprot:TRINITY_DN3376_c0_g1_i2.p1 TRINITY_DN3376_c0_g1~~TRINITY_DN3376_c0_g1_i2.p1  ORF type:complete len:321 (+),score=67.40 TRINITY_DN3376_c0_g1_i2:110-964(+)
MNTKLRQKKLLSADSPSLWNATLAPGWTREETEILRLAMMKFGVGAWTKIVKSGCMPGKLPAQINLQAQRLCGQQALGDFMGIHLDPEMLWTENNAKQGPDIVRKNGCIVNTGNNPTVEQRRKNIEENKKKFGLSKEEIDAIEMPTVTLVPQDAELVLNEKKSKLRNLRQLLIIMESRLQLLGGDLSATAVPQDSDEKPAKEAPVKEAPAKSKKSAPRHQDDVPKPANGKRSSAKSTKAAAYEDGDEDDEPEYLDDDDSDFEKPKRKKAKGSPAKKPRAAPKKK